MKITKTRGKLEIKFIIHIIDKQFKFKAYKYIYYTMKFIIYNVIYNIKGCHSFVFFGKKGEPINA